MIRLVTGNFGLQVGMAATLAGVCQVPLTAVLLLFELTQDYRIVLPLLGAVGLSSWITSGQTRRGDVKETRKVKKENALPTTQSEISVTQGPSSGYVLAEKTPYSSDLCEVESSLCLDDSSTENEVLKKKIFVSEAMRTQYVTVFMSTLVTEAVSCMLAEKQSCALIVDDDNVLVGLLNLGDVEDFIKTAKAKSERTKVQISSFNKHPNQNCFKFFRLLFKVVKCERRPKMKETSVENSKENQKGEKSGIVLLFSSSG